MDCFCFSYSKVTDQPIDSLISEFLNKLMYLCIEPIEFLNPRPRKRRDTEDDNDADLLVFPRIPNPIACLSSGDMLIFDLTINYTGIELLIFKHVCWFNYDIMINILLCTLFPNSYLCLRSSHESLPSVSKRPPV